MNAAGAKLVFLLHAPAAATLGFSIGYVLKRPAAPDARDAAIMIPIAFVATVATQALGIRWIRRAANDELRQALIAGQLAGLLMAPVLLIMAMLVLL